MEGARPLLSFSIAEGTGELALSESGVEVHWHSVRVAKLRVPLSECGVEVHWHSVRVAKLRVPLSPECIPRLFVALEAGRCHAGVNLIDLRG